MGFRTTGVAHFYNKCEIWHGEQTAKFAFIGGCIWLYCPKNCKKSCSFLPINMPISGESLYYALEMWYTG